MSRDELAARQAELVAALVAGEPAPPGFDAGRLAVEARALAAKRRRVLGERVTGLLSGRDRERLSDDLERHLDAWIADRPRADGTSVRDDAAAFVAALRARGLVGRRWWRRS